MGTESAPSRPVSKLSRYLYGIVQSGAAFVFVIVGLLMLARGGFAGLVVIVIGVALAIAAVVNVRLAQRPAASSAAASSAAGSSAAARSSDQP